MHTHRFLAALVLFVPVAPAAAQMPTAARIPAESQIAAAIQAAPADRQDGAKVYGYTATGEFTVLRQGSNDTICLADDPSREGIELNCYHVSLEPFMARGRQLTADGVPPADRTRIRYEEIENGRLKMPEVPAILYTLHGSAYDATTNTVADPYSRQTIYTPGATPESTGLTTMASDQVPWIMFPGTPGAHIMITPPRAPRGGS